MTTGRPILVRQLPESMTRGRAQQLLSEIAESLEQERPQMVFDFSTVRQLDSAGIEVLLRSMEEVMKRGGDLKLAAIPAGPTVILELTRVDRLFEIFATTADAVESFHRFTADAALHLQPSWYVAATPGNPRAAEAGSLAA
jgi:anti-sigma B factor antagonist